MDKILILIQCPDKVGLVAAISDIIASNNLNITVMREFVDQDSQRFFTRVECAGNNVDMAGLKNTFQDKLGTGAVIRIYPEKHKKKIAVLVSREYHCLGDILVKYFFGKINAEICCVIGNHDVLGAFTRSFSIPFHHISNENKSRQQFEDELSAVLNNYRPEYIFLAKFMRILSPEFIDRYTNKIINIHHSFLPAFIGARPYKQAYERGVKIIGASAHFVTAELDNGPIIVQETIHINHNYNLSDMKQAGHEIERNVLAKAMKLVLEDRVFVIENKTVIFE